MIVEELTVDDTSDVGIVDGIDAGIVDSIDVGSVDEFDCVIDIDSGFDYVVGIGDCVYYIYIFYTYISNLFW